MAKYNGNKIWVGCTLLSTLAIVLQFITGLINIGGFNFTFVLIPIIIGAVFYDMNGGVIVGCTFGLTVLFQCIIGYDPAGAALFELNPYFTIIATVGRTTLLGFLTVVVYRAIRKLTNKTVFSSIITSFATPILNTSIFIILYATLFNDVMISLSESLNTSAFSIVVFTLVGKNFLVELITTVILCPPIIKAIEKVKTNI